MKKSGKLSFTFIVVIIVVYIVFRVSGFIDAPESWPTYTSMDGGFSILTPGSLQTSDLKVPTIYGDLNFKVHSIKFVKTVYKVAYSHVPIEVREGFSDNDLLGMEMLFLAQDGYHLGENNSSPWEGHPSVYSEWDSTGRTYRLINRIILANDRLYRVTVIVENNALESERPYFEKFLNSFKLTAEKTGGGY